MENMTAFLDRYFTLFEIPGSKVLIAAIVLILTILMRKLFSVWILRYLKHLTERTQSSLDDALLKILDPPLRFLIILLGIWVVRVILGPVNPAFDNTLSDVLQFGFVVVVCWLIYRSADVFIDFLSRMASQTDTELDDLLVPYLQKVIKIFALLLVVLKAAEVFLGMSAAALFGLLGGMGLTLGLVFKDIVANWFGCGVIYIDNLFREGDWVQLDGGDLVDADVEEIGIRSTRFRNFDKTLSVVPNAIIMNAVVKNWSRMYKRRVNTRFTIDGISAEQMERLLDQIRTLLAEDEGVHQEFHMVNFRELDGNARVIRLYYFTKTLVWKEHEAVRERVNLKILKRFEAEQIDRLAYTIVDLSDDRPSDFRQTEPQSN